MVLWERSFIDARSDWVSLSSGHEFRIDASEMTDDYWRRGQGRISISVRSASIGEHAATVRQLSRIPPYVRELRHGLDIELADDRTVAVRRNGPRPLSRWRVVQIYGSGIEWRATGSWIGTRMVDLASGELLFRSHLNRYRIRIPVQGERAALLLALVTVQIPQSLSPFFWQNSL